MFITHKDGLPHVRFKGLFQEGVLWTGVKTVYFDFYLYEQKVTTGKDVGPEIYIFNGHVYVGEWKQGNPLGKGILVYPNGDLYKGYFIDGLCHGPGTLTREDGAVKYDGEWKNGKFHGSGIFIDNDNKSYKGLFREGLFCGSSIERYFESMV
jgi:hypothetical protein